MTVRDTGGDTVEITVAGWVDDELEEAICEALPETERQGVAEAAAEYRVRAKERFSPAERGETLQVPGLATEIQGELQLADTDLFMEFREWSLLGHPVRLTEDEFAIRDVAHGFEIDVDGKRITHRFVGEEEQLTLVVDVEGWGQGSVHHRRKTGRRKRYAGAASRENRNCSERLIRNAPRSMRLTTQAARACPAVNPRAPANAYPCLLVTAAIASPLTVQSCILAAAGARQ